MAKEKIIVQLTNPERKYVRTYLDFLDNSFLTTAEQMVFIVLKSYIDFSVDSGGVFPSLETICKRSKLSESSARRTINSLIKKGIVKKIRRGLAKTNLYTLADYPTMWNCKNLKDLAIIVENNGVKPLTLKEHIEELEKMGYKVEIKEKELESEPTKAQNQALNSKISNIANSTINSKESQELERYTMDDIHQLFYYDIMLIDYPDKQRDIDSVMDILYTAMNTTKKSIRIAGEDKPTMVVISKLMKLDMEVIMYTIEKFAKQTE